MDDEVKTMSRKLLTFMHALESAGGFMSVAFIGAMILVQQLQKTIYFTSLIRSLFKYQKIQPPKKGHLNLRGNVIVKDQSLIKNIDLDEISGKELADS